MNEGRYVSGIECPHCFQRIWSRYGHDFRHCFCGYCFIDGGFNYQRSGWGGEEFPRPWAQPTRCRIHVTAPEDLKYIPSREKMIARRRHQRELEKKWTLPEPA